MLFAGIDSGSRTIKVVIADDEHRVVARGLAPQGVGPGELADELLTQVLETHRLQRCAIGRMIATGYARDAVDGADATITEITCHARGVRQLAPGVRTIIEIGGQDSKIIRLDPRGRVLDFAMNDRCAAGSGRFLEILADRFGVDLTTLGQYAAAADEPAQVNSTCVVFAETEIIGLLATGARESEIAAGVLASLASRVAVIAGRKLAPPVVLTGGVALIPGMSDTLAAAIDQPVTVSPDPQYTGALGAALFAASGDY